MGIVFGKPSKPQVVKTTENDGLFYPDLDEWKKTKLNGLFEEIVTKVSVDYSNNEIQDIKRAVRTMLGRVVTRVNIRGLFKISRTQPCGSMAEQTAVWKFKPSTGETYTEFDFLAILDGCPETTYEDHECGVCVKVCKLPADLETKLRQFDANITFDTKCGKMREEFDRLFWRELNYSFVSNCDCLSMKFDRSLRCVSYKDTSELNQYGCSKCVVEMPTGSLSVNDSVSVGRGCESIGIIDCSIVLLWASKTKHMPMYDQLLQEKVQSTDTLAIHVDFLPAFELCKPKPVGEVDSFIVPKSCGRCWKGGQWRKSNCFGEIAFIVNEMSEKHKRCYKLIKYFFPIVDRYPRMKWYNVKTVGLNHSRQCSDSSGGVAECVLKILIELKYAYETKSLDSFCLGVDIFNKWVNTNHHMRFQSCIAEFYTVTSTDSYNTLIQKIKARTESEAQTVSIIEDQKFIQYP